MLAIMKSDIQPLTEAFEWVFGNSSANLDLFADWCAQYDDLQDFSSIRMLKAAHDEYACLHGRQELSEWHLSRLIKHSRKVEKYRNRSDGNIDRVTRYRLVRRLRSV